MVATVPTVGFNVETVEPVEGVSFTVWDVGGGDTLRSLWSKFLHSNEGKRILITTNLNKFLYIMSKNCACGCVFLVYYKLEGRAICAPRFSYPTCYITDIFSKMRIQFYIIYVTPHHQRRQKSKILKLRFYHNVIKGNIGFTIVNKLCFYHN